MFPFSHLGNFNVNVCASYVNCVHHLPLELIHYKSTWVTSSTILGCLSCIIVTIIQEKLPNRLSKSTAELLVKLSLLFVWLCFGISTTTMQPRNYSRGRCVQLKQQQTSPEMIIYRVSERRY